MKTVYLALGSNLGDREENLARAIAMLSEQDVPVLRVSSLYETEPQGLAGQPWFLNQVVETQTALFPRQLLARVKKIEREMGRKPSVRNGPRLIDIDILLYGQAILKTADLEIPHPRMLERRFVIEPLVELSPELLHPGNGRAMRDLLKDVSGQKLRKRPECAS